MTRIGKTFNALRDEGKKAFIPYVMAGHPNLKRTEELVDLLEGCGADIIELGVPFSDPLADGPTIQTAAQKALGEGVTLSGVLELVDVLRKRTQIPIILMTYYNPVFKYGEVRFVSDAVSAGVDGIIVPDLPPDEAGNLMGFARKKELDTIFLLAPTSTQERIKRVAKASSGFIYYVSMTGITGAELTMDSSIEAHIASIRKEADTPIAVGFGIATPGDAAAVARFADGVIVGSAIVKRVSESDRTLKKFLVSLRKAIP